MKFRTIIIMLSAIARLDWVSAGCEQIRIGYVNQERPPPPTIWAPGQKYPPGLAHRRSCSSVLPPSEDVMPA